MRWIFKNKEWIFSGAGVALIVAALSWWGFNEKAPEQIPPASPQQINNGDQGIQVGRDAYINRIPEKQEDKKIAEDVINRLSPDNIRAKSIRAAERELGIPVEEDINQRTFIKDGYRVSISDFVDNKSYQTISIGPVENASLRDLRKVIGDRPRLTPFFLPFASLARV